MINSNDIALVVRGGKLTLVPRTEKMDCDVEINDVFSIDVKLERDCPFVASVVAGIETDIIC